MVEGREGGRAGGQASGGQADGRGNPQVACESERADGQTATRRRGRMSGGRAKGRMAEGRKAGLASSDDPTTNEIYSERDADRPVLSCCRRPMPSLLNYRTAQSAIVVS